MQFVGSASEALECLDRADCDVVVSDVRMPGMSGVQLLTEVQNRHPRTVRLLLSGQADMEIIMDAIGPTHQYLAKPCDAEVLKTTIARACALGDLLQDEKIKRLVSQIESLPSLPSLYLELEEALQSADSSIEKAAAIVSKDVGMMATILKLVNSAFFGVGQNISDPVRAVLFLGLDTLKTLVLTVKVFHQLGQGSLAGFSHDRFWHHSVSVGEQARKIAKGEQADPQVVEHALAGGLLHDVGLLILVSYFPEEYEKTLTLFASQQISLAEAERQTLGADHAEVGAYLLGLWGLATPILEAVAFHHNPAKCLTHGLSPLITVHVANGFVEEQGVGSFEGDSPFFDLDYLAQLGLADRLPAWRNLAEVPV